MWVLAGLVRHPQRSGVLHLAVGQGPIKLFSGKILTRHYIHELLYRGGWHS